MKPLKKAEQKNVDVDHFFYSDAEYEELENIDGVWRINRFDKVLRVNLQKVEDLKIVCNEGYYETVAVMNSGEVVHVKL